MKANQIYQTMKTVLAKRIDGYTWMTPQSVKDKAKLKVRLFTRACSASTRKGSLVAREHSGQNRLPTLARRPQASQ